MREVEFRAKSIDNNEWLYGFYHNETSKESSASDRKITSHHIYTQNFDKYVHPETVGQYTGLKDKNGTKIYEGDIVKTKYGRICKVVWHESRLCFDLVPIATIKNINYKAPDAFDIWYSKNLDVVGNIYDNKELLEENK